MLTIRLIRTGKKNAPSFRIVVIEKTAPPKSGKFLEILGNYNPRMLAGQAGKRNTPAKKINLEKERIEYWLSQGVQVSETVHNLLVKEGVIKGPKIKKKIRVSKKKKKIKEEEKEEKKEISQPTEEAKEKVKEEVKEETKEEKKEIPAKASSVSREKDKAKEKKEEVPVKEGSLSKADASLEHGSGEKEEKDVQKLDKSKEKSKIEKE